MPALAGCKKSLPTRTALLSDNLVQGLPWDYHPGPRRRRADAGDEGSGGLACERFGWVVDLYAFAGGEPDCNLYVFGDNGNAWPSGEEIQFGQRYTLRGTANAEDGRSRTVEMTVTLER